MFDLAMQSVFSILSGYFNALTFEYAANVFPEEWKRFQGSHSYFNALLICLTDLSLIVYSRRASFECHVSESLFGGRPHCRSHHCCLESCRDGLNNLVTGHDF